MSDIVDRLRDFADLFEVQHAPGNLVLHMRAAADEIERLRAGGCARDQGTTQYCAEAARLAAENERLRAALKQIDEHCLQMLRVPTKEYGPLALQHIARAALNGEGWEGL